MSDSVRAATSKHAGESQRGRRIHRNGFLDGARSPQLPRTSGGLRSGRPRTPALNRRAGDPSVSDFH